MQPLSKEEVDRILDNNLVDEFDRLGATPGFVLVPMPFEKVHTVLSRIRHQDCLQQRCDDSDCHDRSKSLQA